jgi:hypothetical protein
VEIEQLNRTQRLGLRIDTSNEKLTALLGKDYSDYRRSWEEAGRDGNLAPSFPLHLDLELQDSCNQACVMCPRNEERHSSLPYGINLKNKNDNFRWIQVGFKKYQFRSFFGTSIA